MSVTTPPPPTATPQEPTGSPPGAPEPAPLKMPKSWSWRLVALGTALTLVLAAMVVVVFASFGGSFSTYSVLQAQLPASSTAVALSAPVEYRNVTIGTVASEGKSVPGGLVSITLHLQTSMLHLVPAGVSATETPVSFFGDAYILLEPPKHIGTATLKPGQVIPALKVGQTASLQATLGDLDNLLLSLHPAQLDSALTALAGALQGQGTSLGKNLDKGNTYFTDMLPLWPTVVSNLDTLAPVAHQFAVDTPDILKIIANQTTTGDTINKQASEVRGSISGSASEVGELAGLLNVIQQPYEVLAADSAPFLHDVSQSPTEIARLLEGFRNWANAWITAETSGPYLNVTTDVVVANPADLGLAVAGGANMASYLAAGLGAGYVNPPTYTSAGSVATNADAALASEIHSQTQVLPEPQQTEAVSQIVTSITGRPTSSSAVSTLLLSPVLEKIVNAK